ncbi:MULTISPECIES: hypothetical protein [Brevibacterium]|nr:hypothetical protein [Brevibacterium casei]QZE26368.1 hypothetical protein K4X33_03865 [Brevibacterium casei]
MVEATVESVRASLDALEDPKAREINERHGGSSTLSVVLGVHAAIGRGA